MNFQVEVTLVVTPFCVAIEYKSFGGPCRLHLQGEMNGTGRRDIDIGIVKMEAAKSCRTMVTYRIIAWIHNPLDIAMNLHSHKSLKSRTRSVSKLKVTKVVHMSFN
jgi:hypothetical protein